MQNIDVPVLIVGAGPAGLTTALFLARSGVRPLVIEKHKSTSFHPRARGLNVRTMEIFRTAELEKAVLSAGEALAKSRYMLFVETLAGKEIRRVPDEELMAGGELLAQFSPSIFSQCAQDELEPLLLAEARRYGAEFRFGTEFVTLEQNEEAVTVTLRERDTSKLETICCQYLVAADGATSPVREALKLATVGLSPGDVQDDGRGSLGNFINIYFQADLTTLVNERWFGICFIENSHLEAVLLPVNNSDRWLLNVSYQADKVTPADFTPEYCLKQIQYAVGTDNLPIKILSILPWQAAARLVERMQLERVFLIGDAAHQMPPAGGFGLNTAIQDAHNLAWKLAEVLQKQATSPLLKTYEAERMPIAQVVVTQAVADLTAPTPDYLVTPEGTSPENEAPSWGDETEGGDQDIEGALLEQLRLILGYNYKSEAILNESENLTQPAKFELIGIPGTRAPHIWVKRDNQLVSILDLLSYEWVLLVGSDGQTWINAVEQIKKKSNLPLAVYQISGAEGLKEITPDSWTTAYGVTSTGAVLVRPDQFIAWRIAAFDSSKSPLALLEKVLQKLLVGD